MMTGCRLQFAAVVYEHPNESVRDAVTATEEAEENQGLKHPTGILSKFGMVPLINRVVCPFLSSPPFAPSPLPPFLLRSLTPRA